VYDADGSLRPAPTAPTRSPAGFATSVRYSEVAAGARVEIRPLDDENLEALRSHLQRRLAYMVEAGAC
jgi:hypothetical protein